MITSFYSYKGGSGRTQLVANLAAYLCYKKGRKVLLIDWDLEAPGLHYYFGKTASQFEKGVIDLFTSYVDAIQNPDILDERSLPYFSSDYKIRISEDKEKNSYLDLIPSGKLDRLYRKKVANFDWNTFYEDLDGKLYIEYLKERLEEDGYDHIFIDSRTGSNDYSGICNIQFPDVNVIVITPSNQSFEGSKLAIKNITSSPYILEGFRNKPIVFPILSRVDLSMEQEVSHWLNLFRDSFYEEISQLRKYLPGFSESKYAKATLLDYKRDLAFGEPLLFKEKETLLDADNGYTLVERYIAIGELLESSNPSFDITASQLIESVQKLLDEDEIEGALRELHLHYRFDDDQIVDSIQAIERKLKDITLDSTSLHITENRKSLELLKVKNSVMTLCEDLALGRNVKLYEPKRKVKKSILYLGSNPRTTGYLRLGAEANRIQEVLMASNHQHHFEFHASLVATVEDLIRLMFANEPQVVHFSNHGSNSGIILEKEDGESQVLSADNLASIFSLFKSNVSCVILASAYSENQAIALAKLIPFVIGVHGVISDSEGRAFSSGFYQALAYGKDFEEAFKFAKMSLEICKPIERPIDYELVLFNHGKKVKI